MSSDGRARWGLRWEPSAAGTLRRGTNCSQAVAPLPSGLVGSCGHHSTSEAGACDREESAPLGFGVTAQLTVDPDLIPTPSL